VADVPEDSGSGHSVIAPRLMRAPVDDPLVIGDVNFMVNPPATRGAMLTANQSKFQQGRTWLDPGNSVAFSFQLPPSQLAQALDIELFAYVSRNAGAPGNAPIMLWINDTMLEQAFNIPDTFNIFEMWTFHVPPAALHPGQNAVGLTVRADAISSVRLSSFFVRQNAVPFPGAVLTASFEEGSPRVKPRTANTSILRQAHKSSGRHKGLMLTIHT